MCMYVCAYIPLLTQVYTGDKIKIIRQQQAGRDLSTFTAITREMNGADPGSFTGSTMGVEEEEGCHTDMHKLEGRVLWKVLFRKPCGITQGRKRVERGLFLSMF